MCEPGHLKRCLFFIYFNRLCRKMSVVKNGKAENKNTCLLCINTKAQVKSPYIIIETPDLVGNLI